MQAVAAARDAYVAAGDQYVLHVNVPRDQPGASEAPGLGRRLFTARIPGTPGSSLWLSGRATPSWSLNQARGHRHPDGGEHRGERFATFDGRRVAVRDFADGSVIWQAPGPRTLAIATVDSAGSTVAMAGGPNIFAGSNKVVVGAQDDPRPVDFSFANFPVGAGCQLGISPDGQLAACASFR